MAEPGGGEPKEDAALRNRLDRLSGALEARRGREKPRAGAGSGGRDGRAISYGHRLASEFVAGVAVGALIGYGLDRWLGTMPLWTIIFFLVGFAAAVTNVIRAASAPQEPAGESDDGKPPSGGAERG